MSQLKRLVVAVILVVVTVACFGLAWVTTGAIP
jgi:hypothetical protein